MTAFSSSNNHPPLGIHYLAEFGGVENQFLNNLSEIKDALIHAADEAGATVVDSLLHQFSPQGVSGVIVIAESHIAIHTWPEHDYIALDIFTCGDPLLANAIYQTILEKFQPLQHKLQKLDRIPPHLKPSAQ